MALESRSIGDDLRRLLCAPARLDLRGGLDPHDTSDAAVLVALYLERHELGVVLTRRREDLRRHPGEISFPGGRREPGERDLRTTALREAEEEIGLDSSEVEIVGSLTATQTITSGYCVHPFVGLIEPGREWTPSPLEVAEVIELPLRRLRESYARRRMVRGGVPIDTDAYVAGEHVVWGATARILSDLLERTGPLLAEA